MRLFGFEISRAKARSLSGVDDTRGWHVIFDAGKQEWQRDVQIDRWSVLSNPTVYACISLISGDIGKLRCRLTELDESTGIWTETYSSAFSPVLRKPNNYQTWQQFIECWVQSKLGPRGNTYVLKQRDNRNAVVAMHVLDPCRCRPLVADDGSVYYELQEDMLAGMPEQPDFAVPASEIIHDRQDCFFHPLVGLSPLFAAALPAWQGLKINENSSKFFENRSMPGGIITVPGRISDELAKDLKRKWEEGYSGDSSGKVAVLTEGMTYNPMAVNARDAELVSQLKMTSEQIAACFHVPPHLVGAGPQPPNESEEAIQLRYYSQCLQRLIEAIENTLDDGLNLVATKTNGRWLGTNIDIDGLVRMDQGSLTTSLKDQVGAGITKLDEARRRLNLPPMTGGNSAYLQQQNFSVAALAKRDALPNPFVLDKPTPNPTPSQSGPAAGADPAAPSPAKFAQALRKHMEPSSNG